jgi:hypothetical protein
MWIMEALNIGTDPKDPDPDADPDPHTAYNLQVSLNIFSSKSSDECRIFFSAMTVTPILVPLMNFRQQVV